MIKRLEILAPAGSEESLTAAVRCGADAVYLGLGALNARRGAKNFAPERLSDVCGYCRERGVKVFLALNTLLFDDEREQAAEAIRLACEAGVFGVIVQDLGVLRMMRELAPKMPIVASTQTGVHSGAGVEQLAQLGFFRAVLPRELSLEEIERIGQSTPIELEVFAHGALCMSFSGQCLLSSVVGGRSGNRGMCAQPCRMAMTGGRADQNRALSLKDMSLLTPESLRALSAAGVCSIKIEGRMKRPEYVAAAVTAAVKAVAGESPDRAALSDIFSRGGFTEGYFKGERGREMFGSRSEEDAKASATAAGQFSALYKSENPLVPLCFSFTALPSCATALTVTDGNGNTAVVAGEPPQAAKTRPTTKEDVAACLSKLGGTCYGVGGMEISLGEGIMLPLSAINAMRREAVEKMREKRTAFSPIQCAVYREEPIPQYKPSTVAALRATVLSASQCTPELLEGCESVALYPGELFSALERPEVAQHREKLVLRQPAAVFCEEKFIAELQRGADLGIKRLMVSGLSGIILGKSLGFSLVGDSSLNITSTGAILEYEALGVLDSVLSAELSAARIRRLGGHMPRGIVGYGRLPLMNMRCCPIKDTVGCRRCRAGEGLLRDEKGHSFLVSCASGIAQLFNCDRIYLADRLAELPGIDFISLAFTDEGRHEVYSTLAAYKNALPPTGMAGFTRGLYFRKVL